MCKSNKVVEAGFKLSLNEQKIILTCIAKNDSTKPLSVETLFEITAKEFSELTGVDIDHAYKALQETAKTLLKRYVIIDNPNATNPKIKQIQTHWISSIAYMADSGTIALRFAYDMLPYLSELKTQFTKYELKHIGGMTSTYGIRLYELLSQYKTIGRREIQVDWLKSHFKIQDAYNSIADLRRYVIEPAINNVNEYSDLTVYAPIYQKTGRKVIAIVFDFKEKQKKAPTAKKAKTTTNAPPTEPAKLDNVAYYKKLLEDNANNDAMVKVILKTIPPEILMQLEL